MCDTLAAWKTTITFSDLVQIIGIGDGKNLEERTLNIELRTV